MDYKNDLINTVLSDRNIQYIVELILKTFTIGPSAVTKCKKLIKGSINTVLQSITRYPQTHDELLELVGIINKACYDDFALYLTNKYPNRNIRRNTDSSKIAPIINEPGPVPHTNMVVISEAERNALLKQYNIGSGIPNTKNNLTMDTFLEYLTNPSVLQMFQMMLNQLNQINQPNQTSVPKKMNLEGITVLSETDVKRLLTNMNTNSVSAPVSKKNKQPKKSKIIPKPVSVSESKSKSKSKSKSETDSDSVDSLDSISTGSESESESETETETETEPETKTKTETESKSNPNNILKMEKRIKEIVDLKNKYTSQPDKKNLDKIILDLDAEKKKLLLKIYEFKKTTDKVIKHNKEKITKLQAVTYSNRADASNSNIEYLDLQIDPTDDYNDLKNIVIKLTSDQKISDISLIDYYLPFNGNNVTRFNGEFAIFLGEKTYRIVVPPAQYTIHTLIKYINSQITFLEFTIDETHIITIKCSNNINTKFDLMTGENTIFPLLGFSSKANSYKNKLSFTGSAKYNLESNKKIFFVLSGTSMEPIEMEFDNKVTREVSLKRVRSGFNIKQIILRFTNSINQYYDFIMPFNMCLRLTYS